MSENVIQLNGRAYDAVTGKVVDSVAALKQLPKQGKVISDFVKAPHSRTLHSLQQITKTHKISVTKPTAHIKPVVKAQAKHLTHHLKAHVPQTTRTLMRSAVKKPVILHPQSPRVQTAISAPSTMARWHTTSRTVKTIDSARDERARQAEKSTFVRHFHNKEVPSLAPKVTYTPVKEPGTSTKTTQKPMSQHEQAMHEATSHTQATPKTKGRRFVKFSNRFVAVTVGAVAFILIGGFILSQSLPQIDVGLASLHAGFSASLPAYTPAGFSLMSHVQAEQGSVTLNYHAVADNRQYTVNEQASNWSDQTLLAYITSTNLDKQTWQDKGHPVYLYGNHLTWVTSGIWYQITDHANLSSTQLLNIATSM